jgi:hypothetical protein
MGIFDLKWKSTNPLSRRDAVLKITDQSLLAEIAIFAPDFYNSSYWDDGGLNIVWVEAESEDSGYKAILKLTDRDLLQKVYNESKSDRIRDKAFKKLTH